jgi:hypothetical protein
MKLGKVNTGSALHILTDGINYEGKPTLNLYCGSSANFRARRIFTSKLEVKEENITCKKCLKAYKEGKAHEYEYMVKQANIIHNENKELTLQEYKEKNISFIIKK